jgi:hypothetical protein
LGAKGGRRGGGTARLGAGSLNIVSPPVVAGFVAKKAVCPFETRFIPPPLESSSVSGTPVTAVVDTERVGDAPEPALVIVTELWLPPLASWSTAFEPTSKVAPPKKLGVFDRLKFTMPEEKVGVTLPDVPKIV